MTKNSEKILERQINVKDLAQFREANYNSRRRIARRNRYPGKEGFKPISYYEELRKVLGLFLSGKEPFGGFSEILNELHTKASFASGKEQKKYRDNAIAVEHMFNKLESVRRQHSYKYHQRTLFKGVQVKTNGTWLLDLGDGPVFCFLYFAKPEQTIWQERTIRQAIYQVLISKEIAVNHHQVVFYDVPRNYWNPMKKPDEGCWRDLLKTIETFAKIWDEVEVPSEELLTPLTDHPILTPPL